MFVYLSKNYCLDYKPLINVNCCVVVIWLGGGGGGGVFVLFLLCFLFSSLKVVLSQGFYFVVRNSSQKVFLSGYISDKGANLN